MLPFIDLLCAFEDVERFIRLGKWGVMLFRFSERPGVWMGGGLGGAGLLMEAAGLPLTGGRGA